MSIPVTLAVCGHCGQANQDASWCAHCSRATAEPPRMVPWRESVVPPEGLRIVGCLLDLLTWAGAGALAWWWGSRYSVSGGVTAAVLTLVVVAALACGSMGRVGRWLGGWALGLRTLSSVTGYPPRNPWGWLGFGAVVTGRTRGGADPLAPARFVIAEPGSATRVALAATPRLHHEAVQLQANGVTMPLGRRLLIGRFPIERPGVDSGPVWEVTDLTRSMSRAHCLVESDDSGRVWITDLGSANGTFLPDGDGGLVRLSPYERTAADDTAAFTCGQQKFTLLRRTRHSA